jgi:glycosyltransferase involved in cell wall biosynthesis
MHGMSILSTEVSNRSCRGSAMAEEPSGAATIAVLLSTFNGERFLPAQLQSLLAQTHDDWVLHWRDDGSSDGTVALMTTFAESLPAGRCIRHIEPPGRIGAKNSFLALLGLVGGAQTVAFVDQDDVWLPEKLARGAASLAAVPADTPALYCARQILADQAMNRIGLSFNVHRAPQFPMALAQNIATGCTMMLNRAAIRLIAATSAPAATIHDWWCYLVVSAAGGQVLVDATPLVMYRQHDNNLVGAPSNDFRRAIAALRRGPSTFMTVFRQHIQALQAHADLLSPHARRELAAIELALGNGALTRIRFLLGHRLLRQTWHETLLFRVWFIFG